MILKKKNTYPTFWHFQYFLDKTMEDIALAKLPPLTILNYLFEYNEEEGILYKIKKLTPTGVKNIKINEEQLRGWEGEYLTSITDSLGRVEYFYKSSIVYFLKTGIEPLDGIKHIDGNFKNFRFENLKLINGPNMSFYS